MKETKILKDAVLNSIDVEPEKKDDIKNSVGIEKTLNKPVKKNLFKKMFGTRKATIISLSGVLSFALIVVFSSVTYINFLNTPVYQGMEARALSDMISLSYNAPFTNMESEMIDQIEDEIGVEMAEGISYYASKSETILITVKISNPNFYEILSFTLNGRLYQTFEFQDGSNSEQIIIRFNVQDTSGIQSVTIDAIKYVQDTSIKNARFEADKTIQIGVLHEDVPSIENMSTVVETTNFGISFVALDPALLIDINTGLNLYLFDGTRIVEITKLTLGRNVIPYSNLRMGQTYEYAIVGTFDILDGNGKRAFILHQDTVETQKGFDLVDIESNYEKVDFKVNSMDQYNGEIMKIELLENGTVVKESATLDLVDQTFDQLKSNTDYLVRLTYDYTIIENGQNVVVTDTVEEVFKTGLRPNPTADLVSLDVSQETMDFEISITDTMDNGSILTTQIFKGTDQIISQNGLVKNISNLLSNTDYRLVIEYQYDLEDNQGFRTMTFEYTFKTLEKIAPTVTFTSAVALSNTLYTFFSIEDGDNLLILVGFELYLNDTLLEFKDSGYTLNPANGEGIITGDISFTVTANGTYRVVAIYQYDLNDGNGVRNINDTNRLIHDNYITYIK